MVTGTQAPRPQELGKKHQELETNTELVVAQALTGGAGCFNGDRPTDSDNVFYAAPNKSETGSCFPFFRIGNCCFCFFCSLHFQSPRMTERPSKISPNSALSLACFITSAVRKKRKSFFKVKEMIWIITNHWTYSIPRRFWMILILKYCILPEG